jgi:hypothetical protein
MSIHRRYQIFDREVVITDKDVERLRIHLCNWQRLHEILLLGVNAEDLRRLVILELAGHDRETIISRLLGRLAKVERREMKKRIAEARERK